MFSKIANFTREVKTELQKATWPWDPKEKSFGAKYKELIDSTVVVMIAMLLLAAFVSLIDMALLTVNRLIFFKQMTEEQKRKQWYVVHVLSGQEQKVHDSIVKRIKTEEMSDYIFEVLLPTERVSEVKRGKKTETTRKFYPGYLIINMWLIDENKQLVDRSWYFIKDTAGVLGFAGTKDKPIPMLQKEVDAMLAQARASEEKARPKVEFTVGEVVKVADGPFQNQTGVVEEIDPERGKLRVSVSIFGRETPVDLEYWQVERNV